MRERLTKHIESMKDVLSFDVLLKSFNLNAEQLRHLTMHMDYRHELGYERGFNDGEAHLAASFRHLLQIPEE